METPDLRLVRATINLPGLRVGKEVLAAVANPYVENCLEHGYLVPVTNSDDGRA